MKSLIRAALVAATAVAATATVASAESDGPAFNQRSQLKALWAEARGETPAPQVSASRTVEPESRTDFERDRTPVSAGSPWADNFAAGRVHGNLGR